MTRLLIDLIGGQKRQRRVENPYTIAVMTSTPAWSVLTMGTHGPPFGMVGPAH